MITVYGLTFSGQELWQIVSTGLNFVFVPVLIHYWILLLKIRSWSRFIDDNKGVLKAITKIGDEVAMHDRQIDKTIERVDRLFDGPDQRRGNRRTHTEFVTDDLRENISDRRKGQ